VSVSFVLYALLQYVVLQPHFIYVSCCSFSMIIIIIVVFSKLLTGECVKSSLTISYKPQEVYHVV